MSTIGDRINTIHNEDALKLYEKWDRPTTIVSDGAYGLASFPGDPKGVQELINWYTPHVEAWSKFALPSTTLWFWNTELGWATVHPLLDKHGWMYVHSMVWDKGMAHIAGNCNTKTLRNFPVVTEMCVQYTRRVTIGETQLSLKDWLRSEWARTGQPFSKANEACGVASAASRKYLTADHLWYFPPPEMLAKLSAYANEHGRPEGAPYFTFDQKHPITQKEWAKMRSVFNGKVGLTNVWSVPPVSGVERMKKNGKTVHMNQKPLSIFERLIEATTNPGDVVWEPFGGTCTAAVACKKLKRRSYSSEIVKDFYDVAVGRLGYDSP